MGVLYTQELADRAAAWQARPLSAGPEGKRSAEGLLELATIWAAINQAALPECIRQCQYSERAQALRSYLSEFSRHSYSPDAMSDTPQSKYQIAPAFAGQTFVDEGLASPVTAENLTDEAAEYFIGKGRKDAFVLRGAQSEVAEAKPDTKGADALKSEKEAHKAEKKAHGETKKELVEVQKQLAETQKQLADLAARATSATAKAETTIDEPQA